MIKSTEIVFSALSVILILKIYGNLCIPLSRKYMICLISLGILNNIQARSLLEVSTVNISGNLSLVTGDHQFHVIDRPNVSLRLSPDPSSVCHHDHVILVTSAPANLKLRNEVRAQFKSKAGVVFLLGAISEQQQQSIKEEHLRFNDFLQSDIVDSYRNLQYFTIFSFLWINR